MPKPLLTPEHFTKLKSIADKLVDAGWISYYDFSPLKFNVIFTEFGKHRFKTIYALMNRDYIPAGGTGVDIKSGRLILAQINNEVFKGVGQRDEFAVLETLAVQFIAELE